jgi:CheY-like chemotaxis protein/DNA-binding Xre family transcriptional regulator
MSEKKTVQNQFLQELPHVLRQRREQLGLSQAELAGKAGLHRTYISQIERATSNITMETLSRIAESLETTVFALVQDTQAAVTDKATKLDILLVEDNPADVHLVSHCLETSKIPTALHVVPDGSDALDFLAGKGKYADANVPGLILLDLNLPKVSGSQVLSEMKNNADWAQIPVVVLSTSGKQSDIQSTYNLGGNSYITKPVNPKDFESAIHRIVEYWFDLVQLPQQ